MSEVKKLLFIINKFAGTGFRSELEGRIVSACGNANIECTIEFTKARGHATELAREGVLQKFDGVVAVGGDGTVNEVGQGLVHTSVPMGILPKGSGNGLARHLGIHMNLTKALAQLTTGKVVVADTFTLNDKLSLNVSGIGFDGHIANLFGSAKKRGLRGYVNLITKEFFNFKEFEVNIINDDQTIGTKKAFMIALGNSSQFGNNARILPMASVTDQQLEQAIVKKIPLHRGVPFAVKMFRGYLRNNKDYHTYSFKQSLITSTQPLAFHVDGEPCGHAREFRVVLQPTSLCLIVPSNRLNKI